MTKHWVQKTISWIIRIAIWIFAGWLGWNAIPDKCVIDTPKNVVGGQIGIFDYQLHYSGKIRGSGGDCVCRISVTEAEYDRQMYGGQ